MSVSPLPDALRDDAEYRSIVGAVRAVATVSILLSGYFCWRATICLTAGREMVENMVQGGLAATPLLTQFIFHHGLTIVAAAAMAGSLALLAVWLRARRVAPVIYAGLAGTVPLLVVARFIESLAGEALLTIITKFNG